MGKRCGTCRLYAANFYNRPETGFIKASDEKFCCADVAMDLPDSWNIRTVMQPGDGTNCPVWQDIPAAQQEESSRHAAR